MNARAIPQLDFSAKLVSQWEQVSSKLQAIAEAIPAQKFDFRPTEEVRTVAEVLRHVAFWNLYVADTLRSRKTDSSANELPKESYATKQQIVGALKDSASQAADGLRDGSSALSAEAAEMVVTFIEHNCEHYGQLAVYARLNNIVPPASRG
jgi:uncharacterized damage-inducible protein DinB